MIDECNYSDEEVVQSLIDVIAKSQSLLTVDLSDKNLSTSSITKLLSTIKQSDSI